MQDGSTLGSQASWPKAINVVLSISSSTSGARLPMNRFAPTSSVRLSIFDLFTLIFFPYNVMLPHTRTAYSASISLWNSTNPNPCSVMACPTHPTWCVFVTLSLGIDTDTTGPNYKSSFVFDTHLQKQLPEQFFVHSFVKTSNIHSGVLFVTPALRDAPGCDDQRQKPFPSSGILENAPSFQEGVSLPNRHFSALF